MIARAGGAAVVVASCVALTGVIGTAALGAVVSTGTPRAPLCVTSGPVGDLSEAQARNARTIVAVAQPRGGTRAALISVMTALTESGLRILGNPNDPDGLVYENEGVGTDHDSLGLFQQRPGWGTAAQRMDPVESTNLFLDQLMALPDWESTDPWVAAQHVQRSAFTGSPNAANHWSSVVGGNYLDELNTAASITTSITGDARLLDCGGGAGARPEGAGALGLPADYAVPPGTRLPAARAVSFALAQLGKPYAWGATGPDAYDCSGLMAASWAAGGVRISRTTYEEIRDGVATDLAHLAPGDLVLTPGSDGTLAAPGHVGMYIGWGLVVVAPHTGDVVRVQRLDGFIGEGISSLRHIV